MMCFDLLEINSTEDPLLYNQEAMHESLCNLRALHVATHKYTLSQPYNKTYSLILSLVRFRI